MQGHDTKERLACPLLYYGGFLSVSKDRVLWKALQLAKSSKGKGAISDVCKLLKPASSLAGVMQARFALPCFFRKDKFLSACKARPSLIGEVRVTATGKERCFRQCYARLWGRPLWGQRREGRGKEKKDKDRFIVPILGSI